MLTKGAEKGKDMILGIGDKAIVTKGKYKGKVVTIIRRWQWAECWYDVEFDNIFDSVGYKLMKQYHWKSLKE